MDGWVNFAVHFAIKSLRSAIDSRKRTTFLVRFAHSAMYIAVEEYQQCEIHK